MELETVFAMYFSTIAGWQFHPGSGHGNSKVLDLVQARDIALDMLNIHIELFPIEGGDIEKPIPKYDKGSYIFPSNLG